MPNVRDIMSTELLTVAPDLSLRDLIELLTREHVAGVPVLEGPRLIGVVTLSDVVGFLATRPGVPTVRGEPLEAGETGPVGGAEGPEVPGEDEAPAEYFAETWADAGGALVERFAAQGSPEWDQLGEHTVRDAMTRELLTVAPTSSVEEAARRMHETGVHRLLVMEAGALVGVVSASDVTAAVGARGLGPTRARGR